MKSRARLIWEDALATSGVLTFVLAVLVSVDERVRERVALAWSPTTITSAGTQLSEVGSAILIAARTQSIEHAPMMLFILVATVLLLCMMRA